MPDDPVVETPATETTADGLLNDTQLEEIFGKSDLPKDTPIEPEKPVEVPATVPETPAEEIVDTAALDELEKPVESVKSPDAPTPESDYLKKAMAVFPTEESVGWGADALQRVQRSSDAAQRGDIAAIIEQLPFLRPTIQNALNQYINANEEQIIENFLRKHDKAADPLVSELRNEIREIKSHLTSRINNEKTAQTNQQQQRQAEEYAKRIQAIDTELPKLLDKVKFTKNEKERNIVGAMFRVALAGDQNAFQAAVGGNLNSLRPVFAKTVKEYTETEKAKLASRVPTKPETPKPITVGAGSTATEGMNVWQRAANWVQSTQRKA